MKKLTLTSFLILVMVTQPGPVLAMGNKANYKIKVTIPAIPGVNVALEDDSSAADVQGEENAAEDQELEPKQPTFLERLEEKIIEANEIVYLVTLIER